MKFPHSRYQCLCTLILIGLFLKKKIGTPTGIEAFSGVRALIGMRLLTPLGCLLEYGRLLAKTFFKWEGGGAY